MALDPYAPCPCGSGKKLKWCCAPIIEEIRAAYALMANQQHDQALAKLDELAVKHPENPEILGNKADMLFDLGRFAEAEAVLDRLQETNPQYGYGYYLRGAIRHEEGEYHGALLLYRKAADMAKSEEPARMSQYYVSISQMENILQRPLAAYAALDIAHRVLPASKNVVSYMEQSFGPNSQFPAFLCKPHQLKHLPMTASAAQQQAWDEALTQGQNGRLETAIKAFEQLAQTHPDLAAAHYNLGLFHAWHGRNKEALASLETYLDLETDEAAATDAAMLMEALRMDRDHVELCDHTEHGVIYRILDPRPMAEALQNDPGLVDVSAEGGFAVGVFLDRPLPTHSEHLALFELPRLAAFMVLIADQFNIMNTDNGLLQMQRLRLEEKIGDTLQFVSEDVRTVSYPRIVDYLLNIRIPKGVSPERGSELVKAHLEQQFEEVWAHKQLKSLGGNTPLDAAAHPSLRRKVLGIIRFLEDICNSFRPEFPYNFDRLRHRLGLPTTKPITEEAKARDLGALSAPELAALDVSTLSDAEAHQAYQAAVRLDANLIAARFAENLVDRPAPKSGVDRYPLYQHLIQTALQEGENDRAKEWLDSGLQSDCKHNEGRRRNDYELSRARLHMTLKEPQQAFETYQELIKRVPSNLDYLGKATEAMLSAGMKDKAALFAEQGLQRAKTSSSRDHAGYFEELLQAAKR